MTAMVSKEEINAFHGNFKSLMSYHFKKLLPYFCYKSVWVTDDKFKKCRTKIVRLY